MEGDQIFVTQHWDIKYNHAAGETGSTFFKAIMDKKVILGKKCPKCKRILLPPRSFCERCFVETSEWVNVGKEGKIEAFTIVYEKFEGLPNPPYAIAYVLLDGASTAIANFVKGIDLKDINQALNHIKVGAKARVAFKRKREGRITDFWYEII
ncbi:Zn-ribbon domain-containing OB-fold protein [Desulfobacterota bacterium AH_259_B03_O07]|nr:Zn-ribbon domain-containing OB-fold protein [Desulfobacterota bacterium AH_259_B03_O07]